MVYRKRSTELILVLAGLGLCVTLVLASGEGSPLLDLACGTPACRSVVHGSSARLGPFSIAMLGVVMYFILALSAATRARLARRLIDSAEQERVDLFITEAEEESRAYATAQLAAASLIIWFVAFAGTATAWILQYRTLFVAESFCAPCFVSALIVTSLCLLACRERWLDSELSSPQLRKLWLAPAAVLLVLGVAAWPSVNSQLARIHQHTAYRSLHRRHRSRQWLRLHRQDRHIDYGNRP